MWYLTSDNDDRVIYIVPQAEPITIGRSVDNQVCNFAIPDDASISRKHATLTVTDNTLFLQDLGSRYGTFLNGSTDKVEINTNIKLNENDVVKFGKINSIYKVNSVTINTCTSTLKGTNLQELKTVLSKIGGVLKNEWDESCNYLTMPAITLTIKVVLALVQGSHIVSTEFWSNFVENVEKLTPLPDPQKFLPAIMESTLNKEVVSFLPNQHRKSLFANKKFVFFSKRQFEMYKPVLIKSGATPLLLSDCKMTVSMLCAENVIVIQYVTSGATQENQAQKEQINNIVNELKSKGKRVIADAEIGLAILYCNLEKYCNPSFSFTSEVVKQNSGQISKGHSKVLAEESQEPSLVANEKENVKINETYTDNKNNIDLSEEKSTSKRKLSELTSEVQLNPNKKLATSSSITSVTNDNNTKRKLSDDQSSNPSKKMALDNDQASNSSDDILGDKSDEMFNFINPVPTNGSEVKTKKLNLAKPQKRRLNESKEDGDLFNFVKTDDDTATEGDTSKQSIFSSKVKKVDDTPVNRNKVTVTPEDITAMRGSKLKDLMDSISKEGFGEHTVKQEPSEELEEKMSALDLCNTIVITCTNLIVKQEPSDPDEMLSVRNFKKFKKVWPLKKQVTIIPSSSMNIVTDINTYSVEF